VEATQDGRTIRDHLPEKFLHEVKWWIRPAEIHPRLAKGIDRLRLRILSKTPITRAKAVGVGGKHVQVEKNLKMMTDPMKEERVELVRPRIGISRESVRPTIETTWKIICIDEDTFSAEETVSLQNRSIQLETGCPFAPSPNSRACVA
jgi:hypothetical protein